MLRVASSVKTLFDKGALSAETSCRAGFRTRAEGTLDGALTIGQNSFSNAWPEGT